MDNTKLKKLKRVLAIICLVLIVGMYIVTLVTALIGTELAARLFRASVAATIALPAFMWLILTFIKLGKRKNEEEK